MFDAIEFRLYENKIEVGRQEFLLGELTMDMFCITPAQFATMRELSENPTRENIQQLHAGGARGGVQYQ